MKRFLVLFMVSVFLATVGVATAPLPANAQFGILPRTEKNPQECRSFLDTKVPDRGSEEFRAQAQTQSFLNDVLGCAIKTGKVRAWMLPFFVTSLIRFILGLSGLIAVLFVVIGGYRYVLGGITDSKDSGKKTIVYALAGLAVAMLSWVIVSIVQVQLTR